MAISPRPSFNKLAVCISFLTISSFLIGHARSVAPEDCGVEAGSSCVDKSKAQPLKIIAIFSILLTSVIGVSAPLFTKAFPALQPDRELFVIVKAFASGIILATGFMHVLPDSFDMLSSGCLSESPWHEFSFTGFVAMLSAIVTLMVDSLATSILGKKNHTAGGAPVHHGEAGASPEPDREMAIRGGEEVTDSQQQLRYRVVAMVLELGIVVHSVVIGLSLGASNNVCSIRGLVAALCFHQMFEGMGLGGCILQAEYELVKKVIMVFFFSITTPLGIAIGMVLSKTYRENSPNALITVGLLNASSAGLLIYMALVDLLAADFMGSKLQANIKL